MTRRSRSDSEPPAKQLELLVQEAMDVAKKARKHHQNLAGNSFYADKLAELRIRATNSFADLQSGSTGDTSALAELIGGIFAAETKSRERVQNSRELAFALRTTWRGGALTPAEAHSADQIFPSSLLQHAGRGYLRAIGRQINGCYSQQFYDGCAVMMRRLLEVSIIEAFEKKGASARIKGADGNYLQLSGLVAAALPEPLLALSRNTKMALPKLRELGHLSAHGRHYTAQKSDIEMLQMAFRVAVEELLRHADLL